MTKSPKLRAIYDHIWYDAREALRSNAIRIDSEPVIGSPRWGVSAVIRPLIPSAVWSAVTAIGSLIGDGHAIYDASNIHITVRSMENYRGAVDPDDPLIATYTHTLQELLPSLRNLEINLRGLTASASGVLLQGWPTPELQRFRERLFDVLSSRLDAMTGVESSKANMRATAHASVVVFTGSLRNPNGLVEFIDSHRSTPFGTVIPNEVELVYYRRLGPSITAETLAKIPFRSHQQ